MEAPEPVLPSPVTVLVDAVNVYTKLSNQSFEKILEEVTLISLPAYIAALKAAVPGVRTTVAELLSEAAAAEAKAAEKPAKKK